MYLFIYLSTPVYNLLDFISLFITFFIYLFSNIPDKKRNAYIVKFAKL